MTARKCGCSSWQETLFFFFWLSGSLEATPSKVGIIHQCKNRVLEEECERVSGGYVQMKFSGFLSMKGKTSFSFFCLNSFIEVKSILHTRDIFNVYNLMRSDICKQL